MEATWIGFHLWVAAVEAAGTTDVDKVRAALGGRRIAAPSGFTVQMDGKTHHLYKPVMIGRITDDGRIVPVSVTEGLVPPSPWSPWLMRCRPPASGRARRRLAEAAANCAGRYGDYSRFRSMRGNRPPSYGLDKHPGTLLEVALVK